MSLFRRVHRKRGGSPPRFRAPIDHGSVSVGVELCSGEGRRRALATTKKGEVLSVFRYGSGTRCVTRVKTAFFLPLFLGDVPSAMRRLGVCQATRRRQGPFPRGRPRS